MNDFAKSVKNGKKDFFIKIDTNDDKNEITGLTHVSESGDNKNTNLIELPSSSALVPEGELPFSSSGTGDNRSVISTDSLDIRGGKAKSRRRRKSSKKGGKSRRKAGSRRRKGKK